MRTVHVLVLVTTLALAAPMGVLVGGGAATPSTLAYAIYPAPAGMGAGAGEPSLGVNWNTGQAFFQNFATTLRVTFDDTPLPASAAWADVTPANSIINVDPILATDSEAGRTFAGGLAGECSILAYTDDDGATWTPMGNACSPPSFDHETIGAGPWASPAPAGALSDRAVYYCSQYGGQAQCAVSRDGGLTFGPGVPVTVGGQLAGRCGSLHGSVNVAPNGWAFVPVRRCAATTPSGDLAYQPGFVYSTSNGQTWTEVRPTTLYSPGKGFDPEIAITPSGKVYFGFTGPDKHPYVTVGTRSPAGVWSWTAPFDAGAAVGVQQSVFNEVVSGDNDRAAYAFLGSPTAGDVHAASYTGALQLYVATTLDGGATWQTVQVTNDPVQRGWVCADGTGCGSGRNLLDFIDMQVDEEGRVLVAFADGCIADCAGPSGTIAQSTSDYATIARQTCGPSLYAANGNVEGTRTCTFGTGTGTPVPLTGALYFTGTTPLNQADLALDIVEPASSLSPNAPTALAPKVASNAVALGGSNVRTFYDASWSTTAPQAGYALDASPQVHLFISVAGENATAPVRLTVHLSDVAPNGNVAITATLANVTVLLDPTPGVQEVVVQFPHIAATLANGLTVTVASAGPAEVLTYYDSTLAPSRIVL